MPSERAEAPTTQAAGAPSGIPEHIYAKRWWTLAVLNLSLVLIVLGNSVLNVALPTLVFELDATNAELQWIVDAYALVFGSLLLTMGALGDRFGRGGALKAGLVIFGAASATAFWATTPEHLIAIRAVMGIGAALVMPATLSILITVFPRGERGKAMGIWAAFAGLGGAIGPVVGGWLLEHFSWPSIFAINIPVVALALIGGWLLVPTSKDPEQGKLDPVGALLSIVSLTGLLFAIIEGPERGWTDELVLTGFALAAITGLAFILWELTTEHPMLPLGFFRERGFSVGTTTISMTFFGMFAVFFVLTQYLQFVQGYSPLQAGIRVLPFAGGMMLGAPNSDRLARRFGTPRIVAFGMLMLSGSLVAFALFQVDTAYWRQAPFFLMSGLGMGFAMAPATTTIMDSVPERKAGVGSAVNDTSREVGGAVGIAVLGSILNEGYQRNLSEAIPASVPSQAREAVTNSVGAALTMAERVGGEQGAALAAAAKLAFVDAMTWTFVAGAIVTLLAALIAWRWLPELDAHSQASAPGPSPTPHPSAAPAAPGSAVGPATGLVRTCHLCEQSVQGPVSYTTTANGATHAKRATRGQASGPSWRRIHACPPCYFGSLDEPGRAAYKRERV